MDALRLIPQLFFEINARVLPGILIAYLLGAATNKDLFLQLEVLVMQIKSDSIVIWILVLYITAHLVGHLIGSLAHTFERLWSQFMSRIRPHSKNELYKVVTGDNYPKKVKEFWIKELGCGKPTAAQCDQAIFLWYDWLRVKNPSIGSIVAKTRSEEIMFSTLRTGFLLSMLIHLIGSLGFLNILDFDIKFSLILTILYLAGFVLSNFWKIKLHNSFYKNVLHFYYAEKY